MFDFIKQQIAAQQKSNEDTRTQIAESNENDLIIECAQLFQELDAMSVGGQEINEYRDVDTLSVALEDDVELEAFEVSMTDGRILDLPADILVHSESYEPMKSVEDFREFALNEIHQGTMSNDEYNNLIEEFVTENYNEYLSTIFQEGVFSAQKLDVKDPSIEWTKMVDFGPSNPSEPNSSPYTVRMNIGYEKLAFNKILLKQKDSIQMIVDNNAGTFKTFGTRYVDLLKKHGYDLPEGTNVWDVVKPDMIMVPVEPVDSFAVIIRAENKLAKVGDDKFIYISLKLAISAAKKDSGNISDIIDLDKAPRFASNMIDNVGLLKESMNPTPILGRTILEGLEFGNDEPPEVNGSESNDNGGGDAVSNDNGDGDTVSNDNATGDEASISNENPDATEAPANDVSKEIAQNVADEKAKEEEQSSDDGGTTGDGLDTATTDIPEDDVETSDIEADTPEEDNTELTDDGDVDSKLADLDAAGGAEEDAGTNIADMDFDEMTPNQLTQAAGDKIKNMTMSQIRQFLQSDDGSVTTEAFVLTKKNINRELDAGLRKCLGILNDSSKTAEAIMVEFNRSGKKLNKILSKASKMTDVYNESERNSLIKLNKCLADLIVSFRKDMGPSDVQVVKRLIKAFVAQAKGVGKIIETHTNDTFQEADVDTFGLPIREI